MKRLLLFALPLFCIDTQMEAQTGTGKILVAYFSQTGNTRKTAQEVYQKVGGDRISSGVDIFAIECLSPYSPDYDAFVEQARREQQQQVRPALRTRVANMAQ